MLPAPRRAAVQLLGLGLLSLSLYAWLLWRYPLLEGLARGRANWATLGERTLAAGLIHGVVYGALALIYLLALRSTVRQGGALSNAIIWGVWLSAALLLLGVFPGESLDIFDYLFRGRMLAEHGASPLAVSPSRYRDLPFYSFITWRGQVDTYGPLWEYASGATAWSVGRLMRPSFSATAALPAYLTGYRLLALGFSALCGALIAAIVRRRNPALMTAALLAWLWNPLVLTATAIGAHNDVILVGWLLLALLLLQRRRWSCGLIVLALAAHVKLTALLLLPVVGLWLVRRVGWAQATRSGLTALAVSVPLSWLLYAPLGGWATLPRMLRERTQFLINSPADLLYRWLQEQALWGEPEARRLATLAATLAFCAVAAIVIGWMLNLRAALQPGTTNPLTDADLWRCGLAVTIAYLLIGSFWLMPWYGLWALPLAALLPERRAIQGWIAGLTLAALWSGLAADTFTFLNPPQFTPGEVSRATVLVYYLPLLSVVAIQILRISGRRRGERTLRERDRPARNLT